MATPITSGSPATPETALTEAHAGIAGMDAVHASPLEADYYAAQDLDGGTESLLGSGNLNFLTLQAHQADAAVAAAIAAESGRQDAVTHGLASGLASDHGLADAVARGFDFSAPAPASISDAAGNAASALPASSTAAAASAFLAPGALPESSGGPADSTVAIDDLDIRSRASSVIDNSVVNEAGDLISNVVNNAGDLLSEVTNTAGDLLSQVVNNAGDTVSTVTDLLSQVVNTAGGSITEILPPVLNTATDLLSQAVDTAGGLIDGLLGNAGGTGPLDAALGPILDPVLNISDTVTGLTDGLQNLLGGGGLDDGLGSLDAILSPVTDIAGETLGSLLGGALDPEALLADPAGALGGVLDTLTDGSLLGGLDLGDSLAPVTDLANGLLSGLSGGGLGGLDLPLASVLDPEALLADPAGALGGVLDTLTDGSLLGGLDLGDSLAPVTDLANGLLSGLSGDGLGGLDLPLASVLDPEALLADPAGALGGVLDTLTDGSLLGGLDLGDSLAPVTDLANGLLSGLSGGGAGDIDLAPDLSIAGLPDISFDVPLDPVESLLGDIDLPISASVDPQTLLADPAGALAGLADNLHLDFSSPASGSLLADIGTGLGIGAHSDSFVEGFVNDPGDTDIHAGADLADASLPLYNIVVPLDPVELLTGDIDIPVASQLDLGVLIDDPAGALTQGLENLADGSFLSLGDLGGSTVEGAASTGLGLNTQTDSFIEALDGGGANMLSLLPGGDIADPGALWTEVSSLPSLGGSLFDSALDDAASALPSPIGSIAEGLGILDAHAGANHGLFGSHGGLFG